MLLAQYETNDIANEILEQVVLKKLSMTKIPEPQHVITVWQLLTALEKDPGKGLLVSVAKLRVSFLYALSEEKPFKEIVDDLKYLSENKAEGDKFKPKGCGP